MAVHHTPDPVAVVGATGRQGGATARALVERGVGVRALVRNPHSDAARRLEAIGAELATVELTNADSVRAALDGAGAVFVMTTMTGPDGTEGEVRLGTTVLDAAVASAVPFILYSSVGGAERHSGVPHFESKRRVEEHLTGLDVASSVLRPTFFMDNLAGFSRPEVVDGQTVIALPLPDGTPLQMVSVRDIGRAGATILADPAQAPRSVEIVGDELTGDGMAEAFTSVLSRPARYQALRVIHEVRLG